MMNLEKKQEELVKKFHELPIALKDKKLGPTYHHWNPKERKFEILPSISNVYPYQNLRTPQEMIQNPIYTAYKKGVPREIDCSKAYGFFLHAKANNLIIFDCESETSHNHIDGIKNFQDFATENNWDISQTLIQTSKSGGKHYIFSLTTLPENFNRLAFKEKGIDIQYNYYINILAPNYKFETPNNLIQPLPQNIFEILKSDNKHLTPKFLTPQEEVSEEDKNALASFLLDFKHISWLTDYHNWILTCMALHDYFQGSSEGFELALLVSDTENYPDVEEVLIRKWESFSLKTNSKVSIGTIFHQAKLNMMPYPKVKRQFLEILPEEHQKKIEEPQEESEIPRFHLPQFGPLRDFYDVFYYATKDHWSAFQYARTCLSYMFYEYNLNTVYLAENKFNVQRSGGGKEIAKLIAVNPWHSATPPSTLPSLIQDILSYNRTNKHTHHYIYSEFNMATKAKEVKESHDCNLLRTLADRVSAPFRRITDIANPKVLLAEYKANIRQELKATKTLDQQQLDIQTELAMERFKETKMNNLFGNYTTLLAFDQPEHWTVDFFRSETWTTFLGRRANICFSPIHLKFKLKRESEFVDLQSLEPEILEIFKRYLPEDKFIVDTYKQSQPAEKIKPVNVSISPQAINYLDELINEYEEQIEEDSNCPTNTTLLSSAEFLKRYALELFLNDWAFFGGELIEMDTLDYFKQARVQFEVQLAMLIDLHRFSFDKKAKLQKDRAEEIKNISKDSKTIISEYIISRIISKFNSGDFKGDMKFGDIFQTFRKRGLKFSTAMAKEIITNFASTEQGKKIIKKISVGDKANWLIIHFSK